MRSSEKQFLYYLYVSQVLNDLDSTKIALDDTKKSERILKRDQVNKSLFCNEKEIEEFHHLTVILASRKDYI